MHAYIYVYMYMYIYIYIYIHTHTHADQGTSEKQLRSQVSSFAGTRPSPYSLMSGYAAKCGIVTVMVVRLPVGACIASVKCLLVGVYASCTKDPAQVPFTSIA
jgi:hypothetical protein